MRSYNFSLSHLKLFQFYRQHQGTRNGFRVARHICPRLSNNLLTTTFISVFNLYLIFRRRRACTSLLNGKLLRSLTQMSKVWQEKRNDKKVTKGDTCSVRDFICTSYVSVSLNVFFYFFILGSALQFALAITIIINKVMSMYKCHLK